MTFTPAKVANVARCAEGEGWVAYDYGTLYSVRVSPDLDALPDAVAALIPTEDQPSWTVLWWGIDEAGWDIYITMRDDTA